MDKAEWECCKCSLTVNGGSEPGACPRCGHGWWVRTEEPEEPEFFFEIGRRGGGEDFHSDG